MHSREIGLKKILIMLRLVRYFVCFLEIRLKKTSYGIVCKDLVPPLGFLKRFGSPFFPPHQTLKIGSPLFVSEILENFLQANLSNFGLTYRNHCKNSLYCHLSMIYTTNVAKGCNVCCRRQIFEEIYGNLSLKVPIFVLFYP